MNIINAKLGYYKSLDKTAEGIAKDLTKDKAVTGDILQVIVTLYKSAKVELEFADELTFNAAYHSPITSELEFFISRILVHFSKLNKLNWKILLRKQESKTAPDIRIERNEKTLAIIEIKAKAGWIQPFLSKDRFNKDMKRLKANKTDFNPKTLIKKSKSQLKKYSKVFQVDLSKVYFLLPTLILVHRKGYKKELWDYCNYFEKTSGLPRDNFVLLSSEMLLDLGDADHVVDLKATKCFERMIYKLKRL